MTDPIKAKIQERERQRLYKATHKEVMSIQRRRYYLKHKERIDAQHQVYSANGGVCSLELAQKLKELGIKQYSLFNWGCYEPMDERARERGSYRWRLSFGLATPDDCYALVGDEDIISAFTVAELGEMLPARLEYARPEHPTYRLAMEKQDTRWNVVYICADCGGRNFEPILAATEADARAKMLIYLLENNLIAA
jgi:hypothetical protein